MRQKNSCANKILESDFYNNGEEFTAADVAAKFGIGRAMARGAIVSLRDIDLITVTGEGRFKKPIPHPIHRRRLIDPRPIKL